MVIFGAITLICSIFAHTYQKRFWFAVLIAACSSVVLFQVASFLNSGYLDPFIMIAIITTFCISSISAVVIGLVFKFKRSKA